MFLGMNCSKIYMKMLIGIQLESLLYVTKQQSEIFIVKFQIFLDKTGK